MINTSDIGSAGSMNDGYEIRKYATENNVNIFTALDTVKVLLDVLEETTLKRFQRLTRKGEEMKQGIFTVTANEELTEGVMRMVLTGDTRISRPGQFVNIKLDGLFLRRPISVCDLTGDRLTIIYKIVGKGTEEMALMEPGQELDVLTGLGNGYSLEESKSAAAHRRRSRRTAHVSSGQEADRSGKEADGHIRLQYCLRDVLRRRIQGSGSRGKGDYGRRHLRH